MRPCLDGVKPGVISGVKHLPGEGLGPLRSGILVE